MAFDRKKYMKEYFKKYYRENKSRLDERVRQWQKAHPEKVKKWARRNREENKDELKEYRRVFGPKINEQIRAYRESTIKAFLLKKWYAIKKKSKTKERYALEITISDLLDLWTRQDGRCAISGKKMEHIFGSPYSVSVDRIDSGIGYKNGNVQLVCQAVNLAKNSFANEEFVYFWTHDTLDEANRDIMS